MSEGSPGRVVTKTLTVLGLPVDFTMVRRDGPDHDFFTGYWRLDTPKRYHDGTVGGGFYTREGLLTALRQSATDHINRYLRHDPRYRP